MSMFSKRHYEALAAAMRDAKPAGQSEDEDAAETQWITDVEEIASVFMADNPKFDSTKFLKACGC